MLQALKVTFSKQAKQSFQRSAAALVHERLEALLERPVAELIGLPECSDERLVHEGVTAQIVTWHEIEPDGSHHLVVQLWETGLMNAVYAAEGVVLSEHGHRPLTRRELAERDYL